MKLCAAAVLLAGLPLAQQAAKEPAQPAFRTQRNLVVVPFQARRGSRSTSSLKAEDVILLEDGVPREFTIFETPPEQPALELVIMFDLTDIGGGFWDLKSLRAFTSSWNQATTQAILQQRGATIRVSLYHFDQYQLQRLCRSTSDPEVLLEALRRLPDPITPGNALELVLPAGTVPSQTSDDTNRSELFSSRRPPPWSLVGAMTVLTDSDEVTTATARALVIFSKGVDGTATTPGDIAERALASDVAVYPVALAPSQTMYAGDRLIYAGRPYNQTFEGLGDRTGGRAFEASGPITVGQVRDILETVKTQALARIGSHYAIGFAPASTGPPRQHMLEVRLTSKSAGNLIGGKKRATY